MGGILQPPCPYGRNIGRCCLPQTRLLAHFSPSFKLKYSHISSFHSPNTTSFHSFKLVPSLPESSHKPQFAAAHNQKKQTTHPGVSAAHETRRHPKQVAPSPTSIPSLFHLFDITENTQYPPRHNLRYFLDVFSSYMSSL